MLRFIIGLIFTVSTVHAFEARVLRVISGDAMIVEARVDGQLKQYRLHLAGVDAPEIAKGILTGQPYAAEAHRELKRIATNSVVTVLIERSHEYGGYYAIVIAQSGICLNTYMAESGLAILIGISDSYYRAWLEESASIAQRNRWNIYSLPKFETPFEYRQRTKRQHYDN